LTGFGGTGLIRLISSARPVHAATENPLLVND
jgi:hypothetical protein